MALETLKGITEIGGFPVVVMDELRARYPEKFNESGAMDYKWFESEIRPKHFIYIRHDVNSISFTVQKGPVLEVGVNGCQIDTLIAAAKAIVEGLNHQFPCDENEAVIKHLDCALDWLTARRAARLARGVEGRSET